MFLQNVIGRYLIPYCAMCVLEEGSKRDGTNFFMGGRQNQTGHCFHPCGLNWPEFYHGIKIMPSWLVYIEFHHGTKIMPFLNGIKIMPRWLFYYIYSISSWHYFNANFGVTYIHVTISLVLTKILCWIK